MFRRLSAYYINRPFQQKMMLVMLLVLGMTVAVLSYSNISVLNRSFGRMTNEQTVEMAGQVTLRIKSFILDTNQLIDYIITDPAMTAFVGGDMTADDEERLIRMLERYSGSNKDIAGLLAVDRKGNMFSGSMDVLNSKPLIFEDWYLESAADADTFHVFSRPIGRNITSFTIPTKRTMSSLSARRCLMRRAR